MQVLVNCDDHICCDAELIRRVEGVIAGTLERFGEHLSRVEVWLRDLNSENRAIGTRSAAWKPGWRVPRR